jgi:hypothetical protein
MASLSKDQVKGGPDWDADKPVSRQYEALFAGYYRYLYYWAGNLAVILRLLRSLEMIAVNTRSPRRHQGSKNAESLTR